MVKFIQGIVVLVFLFCTSIYLAVLILTSGVYINLNPAKIDQSLDMKQLSIEVTGLIHGEPNLVESKLKEICSVQKMCFTSNEIEHLKDVSVMIENILEVASITGIIILMMVAFGKNLRGIVASASKTGIGLVLVLVISAYFYWDIFFVTFHQIFFPQGNWMFSINSLLIRLFPERFWTTMATGLFFLLIFQLVVWHWLAKKVKLPNCPL